MRTAPLSRVTFSLVATLALAACKSSGGTLVDVVAVEPGAECAAGGVRIETGVDDDGDGALSDDEIATSDVICEGEDPPEPPTPAGVATRATDLPVGDADCPWGGVRVDAGLDDGAGGGTANDGVLQDGEIDSTAFVCEPAPPPAGPSLEPPAGTPGTAVIDLAGGDGSLYQGGDAGALLVTVEAGTGAGGIRVFPTGMASTGHAFPTDFGADLGPVPVTVSADTTLLLDPVVSSLSNGTLYVQSGQFELFVRDATTDDGYRVATGLKVEAGATLTVPANHPGRGAFSMSYDLHVAGTVTTVREGGHPADLDLNAGAVVAEATGRFDVSGADGAGADGGQLRLGGRAIVNAATVDVSGGDGSHGGDAGDLQWSADTIWNRGTVLAHGGRGTSTYGGEGAAASWMLADEVVFNEGTLDLRGGDGTGAEAGDGGWMELSSTRGAAVNLGAFDGAGGAATACTSSCNGGDGGTFWISGVEVVQAGALRAPGGAAPKIEANTGTTNGGAGGDVWMGVGTAAQGLETDWPTLGDIQVSGEIDLSGGAGGAGGDAGEVEITADYQGVAADQQVLFLGYASADVSGGDGVTGGGDGGEVSLGTYPAEGINGVPVGPGGGVANHVDFDLTGGDGQAGEGSGGGGGAFVASTGALFGATSPTEVLINRADILADGGNGVLSGAPGYISLYAAAGVEHSGVASAGTGDSEGGHPHMPAGLFFSAEEGPVVISGTVRGVGGDSTSLGGGQGAWVHVIGTEVTVSGTIDVHGGAGVTRGGWGGSIDLTSTEGSTSVGGTLDVTVGAGPAGAGHGQVIVDGEDVTADWTP